MRLPALERITPSQVQEDVPMKPIRTIPGLVALSLAITAASALAQGPPALKLPRASQNAGVTQTLGTTDLAVKYCRPGVKGRAIWGGLVPYDQPWRTGANEVTTFSTSDTIQVEGQTLPAGTYGLVTIPGASTWAVVFSNQKDMWGAYTYDPKQDQLRVTVTPQPAEMVEWMQFTFDVTAPDAAELALRWEKLRVPVRITVDVKARILANARVAVAGADTWAWNMPFIAANYAFDNGMVTDETAAWAARAAKLAPDNWRMLALNAKYVQKAGRTKEAVDQMTRAVALCKANKDSRPEYLPPMEKLLAEWTAKK
jgi:hypothetical protein